MVVRLAPSSIVNYGPEPLQTNQIFPSGPTVVALVHGGGFKSYAGNAAKLRLEAVSLQRDGFTAVIVNYSEGSVESETNDVLAGIRAVNATVCIGGSSGGTLCAYAAEKIPLTLITLSGDLDPGQALTYWKTKTGPVAKTHVNNLTAAGVTPLTRPPVLSGKAYTYASAGEDPNVMAQSLRFGGTSMAVPGSGHAWAYWRFVKSSIETQL